MDFHFNQREIIDRKEGLTSLYLLDILYTIYSTHHSEYFTTRPWMSI